MKCQQCGMDAYMGFTCRRCGKYFCVKDHLPENHNCEFKNMRSEAFQVRMQLEPRRTPVFDRSPDEDFSGSRYPADDRAPGSFREDDEDGGNRYSVGNPLINMSWYLLIFVIFAAFDVVNMFFFPSLWAALPVIIHGVFLPILVYMLYKQRKEGATQSGMVAFIQLLITYMVTYLIAEIIVAVIFGNYFTIGIDVFIGICMVILWRRVLQQMRYMFGQQR